MKDVKPSSMEAFLKGHRGGKTKQFLGVIGSYLVEILDENPMITSLLSKSQYHHLPSADSRFVAPTKRLILTSFSNDILVIIKNSECSLDGDTCELAAFVNNSREDSETILADARVLAKHRWSKISF